METEGSLPPPPPPKKDEKGGRYPYGASFARACSGLFGRRPVTHGCVYEVFITSEEHHEEIEIEREGGGDASPSHPPPLGIPTGSRRANGLNK